MQRRYNEEWVTTLLDVRSDLDEVGARVLVHAAIGAIQSSVTYDSGPLRSATHRWSMAVDIVPQPLAYVPDFQNRDEDFGRVHRCRVLGQKVVSLVDQ